MTTPTPDRECKAEEVSADQMEIRRLRHELDGLTRAGVVECMARNPAVFERISDLERDLAAREEELARVKEQADKFKWQVRDTCQRAERAEAERDAAVFAINNHNKDCKASCEEQRSRNSCGFASYYPKKNCPNCPEDWAIDAIGRKP